MDNTASLLQILQSSKSELKKQYTKVSEGKSGQVNIISLSEEMLLGRE